MVTRSGFTLIEQLVVVTILVLLLALLAPALDRAVYSAELTVCGTTLRTLASSAAGVDLNFAYQDHSVQRETEVHPFDGEMDWLSHRMRQVGTPVLVPRGR